MIPVNMPNFKLLNFLLLVTKISFPEWINSLRFDVYPLEANKTREKSLFMPENIFPGTNLYPPLHLHGFEAKQKICMFDFSRRLNLKTTAATPW